MKTNNFRSSNGRNENNSRREKTDWGYFIRRGLMMSRGFALALCGIVVFTTVYSMILPGVSTTATTIGAGTDYGNTELAAAEETQEEKTVPVTETETAQEPQLQSVVTDAVTDDAEGGAGNIGENPDNGSSVILAAAASDQENVDTAEQAEAPAENNAPSDSKTEEARDETGDETGASAAGEVQAQEQSQQAVPQEEPQAPAEPATETPAEPVTETPAETVPAAEVKEDTTSAAAPDASAGNTEEAASPETTTTEVPALATASEEEGQKEAEVKETSEGAEATPEAEKKPEAEETEEEKDAAEEEEQEEKPAEETKKQEETLAEKPEEAVPAEPAVVYLTKLEAAGLGVRAELTFAEDAQIREGVYLEIHSVSVDQTALTALMADRTELNRDDIEVDVVAAAEIVLKDEDGSALVPAAPVQAKITFDQAADTSEGKSLGIFMDAGAGLKLIGAGFESTENSTTISIDMDGGCVVGFIVVHEKAPVYMNQLPILGEDGTIIGEVSFEEGAQIPEESYVEFAPVEDKSAEVPADAVDAAIDNSEYEAVYGDVVYTLTDPTEVDPEWFAVDFLQAFRMVVRDAEGNAVEPADGSRMHVRLVVEEDAAKFEAEDEEGTATEYTLSAVKAAQNDDRYGRKILGLRANKAYYDLLKEGQEIPEDVYPLEITDLALTPQLDEAGNETALEIEFNTFMNGVTAVVVSREVEEPVYVSEIPFWAEDGSFALKASFDIANEIEEGAALAVSSKAGMDSYSADKTWNQAVRELIAKENGTDAELVSVSFARYLSVGMSDKNGAPVWPAEGDVTVHAVFAREAGESAVYAVREKDGVLSISGDVADTGTELVLDGAVTENETIGVVVVSIEKPAQPSVSGNDGVSGNTGISSNDGEGEETEEDESIFAGDLPASMDDTNFVISIPKDAQVPAGAQVSVTSIFDDEYEQKVKSVLNKDGNAAAFVKFFSISVMDENGSVVVPAAPVHVEVADKTVVTNETGCFALYMTEDGFVEKLSSDSYSFDCLPNGVKVYAIAATCPEEEAAAGTEEAQSEEEKEEDPEQTESAEAAEAAPAEAAVPAVVYEHSLQAYENGVTVTAEMSDDAQIPAGSRLIVRVIEEGSDEYKGLVKQYNKTNPANAIDTDPTAMQSVGNFIGSLFGAGNGEPTSTTKAKMLDISIEAPDGTVIEPNDRIRISIRMDEAIQATGKENVSVVHFEDQKTVTELTEAENAVSIDEEENGFSGVSFDTDGLSPYAVIYTVDYAYEANGEKHTASMDGGSVITLSQLFVELGVAGDQEAAASYIRENIDTVTFSKEGVVEIIPVEESTGLFGKKAVDWTIAPLRASDGSAYLILGKNGKPIAHINVEIKGVAQAEAENTVISAADGRILPEDAQASAEVLGGDQKSEAVDKVETFVVDEEANAGLGERFLSLFSNKEETEAEKSYKVFDISLENVEAEQYANGFKVDVTLPGMIAGSDFALFHIHDENVEELPVELVKNTTEDGTEVVTGISFVTKDFSEFVLRYTVDFEYSVNGKMYQFSLPGGGFVSFTDLVEVLGIIGDTDFYEKGDENGAEIEEKDRENVANEETEENGVNSDTNTELTMGDVEVNETTRKFVSLVASVEFSSPELMDVSKIEADTTVGKIKESRGLECQYSAELTEEQIAEINAQTVEAGDWALISVQPFTSEETLTVTMKNGDQFGVKVTDAQIKKTVIDAKGDTWEISVVYDDNAEIPDGAELRVEEILPEDERYEQYYQQSLKKVSVVNTSADDPEKETAQSISLDAELNEIDDNIENQFNLIGSKDYNEELGGDTAQTSDYARIFDIQIRFGEQEIQPKSTVTVNINLLDAPEDETVKPSVVHFANDGTELMDLEERTENSEEKSLQFVTDEFSVYCVMYTVDFSFIINGKEYAFSIEGGDSTSFKEIAERFKILDKENFELFINNISSVEFSNPDYLWNGKLEEDAFAYDLKEMHNLDIQYASNIREGNILAMNNHHYSAPDWVLIALKPFTSEEKLIITMKSGETFTVKVTDDPSDAMHNPDGTVQTVPNPQGTTFELFNYYVDSSTKTTAGRDQWPGHIHDDTEFWKFNWYDLNGNYACDWGEGFGRGYDNNDNYLLGYGNNLGINNGHVFKFSPANAGTVIDGTKGTATKDVDGGSGLNGWTQDADPNQGIVQGTLVNGYPAMTTNPSLGTDGSSLAYLFDSSTQEGKDSYGNVNNLLYVDPDGYYTYDSRDFSATYQDGGFVLRDQPDSATQEEKGYWPFGTGVYWSGLHMNTQFSMPENGKVLNPKDELKDMQFEFSGDDDTWLYVDGVLVGDGGGIHNRTEIDINFATGKVTVTGKKDPAHMGSFEETKWLDDIFRAAGKYNDADWEDIGDGSGHKRFKAGTYHTFDMFYLERGGGESNLYIHYNLVSTDDFTGHKSYEGFAEDERMVRDQFHFEMIGLDGQYQSVWNSQTQTADVTLIDPDGHAIMPSKGSESGEGTFDNPKKVYSNPAYTDSNGNTHGGTVLTTGVLENGDIRFGSAEINADEMLACDQGHPSLYRYIIREIVPDDAVNKDGITWADANEETREEGGFVKDQVLYDGQVYYMTARVTSWEQTGADGQIYTAYGLSKTYYTDDTFTEVDNSVRFVDFRNIYAPGSGEVEFTKVDGTNTPLAGAEFTLYTDSACTNIAKDLGNADEGISGTNQVKSSDESGIIRFENLAAPRTYYMKETTVPAGYEQNETIYKVVIEDSKDKTKSSKIYVFGDESNQEITKVINTKAGEISVVKNWIDQNGRDVTGSDYEATVQLRRYKYEVDESSVQEHNLTISYTATPYSTNTPETETRTISFKGTAVSIIWEVPGGAGSSAFSGYDNSWWDNARQSSFFSKSFTDVSSDISASITLNEYWVAQDKGFTINSFTIREDSGAVKNLVVDLEFPTISDTVATQTLSSSNNWAYTWTIGNESENAFPATDGVNPYLYYLVEIKEDGTEIAINEEFEEGKKLISITYSPERTDNAGIQQGSICVVNQVTIPETINIVIKKTDNAENSTNYLEGAVFKLMYRSDSSGTFTNVSRESVPELDSESKFTVPTSGITLTGLVDGQYQLQEISPPVGYVITNSTPVTFTVSGGTITSTEGTIIGVRYSEGSEISDAEFIVPNEPGTVLPSTGGSGTRLFTIFGSILILGAGALMWRRRRTI